MGRRESAAVSATEYQEVRTMFQRDEPDTEFRYQETDEDLARRLFLKHYAGYNSDVAIGDTLRACLQDVVDYVVRELGANLEGFEWDQETGIQGYPYTSDAILQVVAVTS